MDNNNEHPREMQHEQRSAAARSTDFAPGGELALVDLLIVLARRKKFLIAVPLLIGIIAVGVSLILPNVYSATTKLLPPQQSQSGASAMLAQFGGVAGLAGLTGVKSQGEIYIGMLKSRTVADRLVARFVLKNKYDTQSQEKARLVLATNTLVSAGKDGMIGITVEDRDPKMVAQLANGYVEELQRLSRTMAITEVSQRRMFFEQQLDLAKNNLAKVEISLKSAMDSRGVISVDSESKAILETAALLRAQVSAKEIQLGSMRAFVTAQNPEFQRATEELGSLRSELAKLEGGRARPSGEVASTRAGLANIQLMRDLKYYQMLYELLAKQYEVARLDEAKEPSLIQVLDVAIEPERKSKPKRAVLVLASTLLAFFGALLWVLISAARQRAMRMPESAIRWNELESHLRFRKKRA